MTEHHIPVTAEEAGQRLDRFVSERLPELSRSAVQRLCEEARVTAGGQTLGKNYKLRGGEEIVVTVPDPKPLEARAQDIPLDIVYEDEQLIVVNKPQGLVVHPAPGHEDGTLVNALLFHCAGQLSGIGGVQRPGIVHRIDKDTSGLLVAAKSDRAHEGLSEQVKAHSFTRIYEAVLHGQLREQRGTVDLPIARHPSDRKKMCIARSGGREAITHYSVLARYRSYCHAELRLETGRTHQIRVHMAQLGHPVAGDPVYGPAKGAKGLEGQCLHARTLGFVHPVTGQALQFDAPLPESFTRFLSTLGPAVG